MELIAANLGDRAALLDARHASVRIHVENRSIRQLIDGTAGNRIVHGQVDLKHLAAGQIIVLCQLDSLALAVLERSRNRDGHRADAICRIQITACLHVHDHIAVLGQDLCDVEFKPVLAGIVDLVETAYRDNADRGEVQINIACGGRVDDACAVRAFHKPYIERNFYQLAILISRVVPDL